MVLTENSIRVTYYDILSVKEDASYDEIRSSYRSAILHSHPDKLNNSSQTSHSNPDDRFLKIQKAWEVLGNAKSRAIYDNDLQSSREDAVTADEISIEDMLVAANGEEFLDFYYQCRCGDYFFIDSSELCKMGFESMRDGDCVCFTKCGMGTAPASVLLPCGSCSLKIRMWVDTDISIPLPDDPL